MQTFFLMYVAVYGLITASDICAYAYYMPPDKRWSVIVRAVAANLFWPLRPILYAIMVHYTMRQATQFERRRR